MKKFLLLMAMLTGFAWANAIKVHTAGNLVFLNGVNCVNIKFTYDNLMVEETTEANYIKKKVSEYNAHKPGKGDEFAKTWEMNKQQAYPKHFIDMFEKNCNMSNNNFNEQKYSFIVNTHHMEPGVHAGVGHKIAEISIVIRVVETAYPDKVLAEISISNCPGWAVMGHEFNAASRLAGAYEKAGKELGKIIKETCQ